VDVQGAAERLVKISSGECGTATVNGADNTELRLLTVEQAVAAGCGDAWAILNDNASPRISQVTAFATGGNHNYGVRNQFGSPVMTNVTASAVGASQGNSGVFNFGASPTMVDVSASAEGGQGNMGVGNHTSTATMRGVTASALGGLGPNMALYNESSTVSVTGGTLTASGASENLGATNGSSTVTFDGVTVRVSGADSTNWGMQSFDSTLATRNCVVEVDGDGGVGLYHFSPGGSYTSTIDHTEITASFVTVKYDGGYTVLVGASRLAGGQVGGDGTIVCAGVYDEAYVFYPGPECPN
jgi:hypothetical protein